MTVPQEFFSQWMPLTICGTLKFSKDNQRMHVLKGILKPLTIFLMIAVLEIKTADSIYRLQTCFEPALFSIIFVEKINYKLGLINELQKDVLYRSFMLVEVWSME